MNENDHVYMQLNDFTNTSFQEHKTKFNIVYQFGLIWLPHPIKKHPRRMTNANFKRWIMTQSFPT